MNKSTHSPLPWDFAGPDKEDLVDSKKEFIIDGSGIFIYSGDRELTIRAVNSYYQMLEALKEARTAIDHLWAELIETDETFFPSRHHTFENLKKITEAINIAENTLPNEPDKG